MLDCFPDRIDAAGAPAKAAALAGILAEYPDEIVRLMTDPVRGMPVRQKWAPVPFEMKEACEQEFAPFRRQWERDRAAEASLKLVAAPVPAPEDRLTKAEIIERFGETYGLESKSAGKPHVRKSLDEIKKIGCRDEPIVASEQLLRLLDEKDTRERNYSGSP